MDGKAVIRALNSRLEHYKSTGINQIPTNVLEQDIEAAKQHAHECYDYEKMQHEMQLEMFRSVISSGSGALKSAFILNGGGAVALLTFYGRINSSDIAVNPSFLALALFIFCVGVFLTAIGGGATYITQHAYMHNKNQSMGKFWQLVSLVLTSASYGAFLLACHSTATALGLVALL